MGNVGIIRHISPFSLRNAGAFSFQVDGWRMRSQIRNYTVSESLWQVQSPTSPPGNIDPDDNFTNFGLLKIYRMYSIWLQERFLGDFNSIHTWHSHFHSCTVIWGSRFPRRARFDWRYWPSTYPHFKGVKEICFENSRRTSGRFPLGQPSR
jgi:hypothetical protein